MYTRARSWGDPGCDRIQVTTFERIKVTTNWRSCSERCARYTMAAAGLSAGLWLVFVVLYDLGLLGAVVMDGSGDFTRSVFPWLMVANPADAFRVWNISASDGVAMASGMVGAAQTLPAWAAPLSLALWPLLAFGLARAAFKRVEP